MVWIITNDFSFELFIRKEQAEKYYKKCQNSTDSTKRNNLKMYEVDLDQCKTITIE